MEEIWLVIPGYEDYAASNAGRIRRATDSRTSRAGKMMKPKLSKHGYLHVTIRKAGRPKCHNVHRLICMAFNGLPASDCMHACHQNGDRADNRPENLRWDFPLENTHDKYAHGTFARVKKGAHHWRAKLTPENVSKMRDARRAGVMLKEIAAQFGVSKATASEAIRGKSWGHVHERAGENGGSAGALAG